MKFNDLQKMPKDELAKKLHDLRVELMKLNAQVAIGTTPKSTKQIREIKRTIAKAETLTRQLTATQVQSLQTKKKAYKSL